jgi:hypothetical protein
VIGQLAFSTEENEYANKQQEAFPRGQDSVNFY